MDKTRVLRNLAGLARQRSRIFCASVFAAV
jgi:hypothetical protein